MTDEWRANPFEFVERQPGPVMIAFKTERFCRIKAPTRSNSRIEAAIIYHQLTKIKMAILTKTSMIIVKSYHFRRTVKHDEMLNLLRIVLPILGVKGVDSRLKYRNLDGMITEAH